MLGSVTISGALGWVVTAIAITTATGGVVAFLWAAQGRGLIDLLEKEVKAQEQRGDRFERESADSQRRCEDLERRLEVVSELATGAAAANALSVKIDQYHYEVMAMWETMLVVQNVPATKARQAMKERVTADRKRREEA